MTSILLGIVRRCSEGLVTAMLQDYTSMRTEIVRQSAAIERMLIGGNHLATYHKSYWPPVRSDPTLALETIGAGMEYDVWCCWNAIMCARNDLGLDK